MRIRKYIAMAQHHALGPPRRARRVHYGRQRGGFARNVARIAAIVGEPLFDRLHPRVPGGVRLRLNGQDAHQSAELVAHAGEFLPLLVGAEQQHLALRIIEYVGDVVGTVLGIERDHDQPQPQRRLVEYHPFRRVAQHDRHAVAGLEAIAFERGLPARDLMVDLRPSVITPVRVLAIEIAISDCIRRAPDAFAKESVKGHCFRGSNDVAEFR